MQRRSVDHGGVMEPKKPWVLFGCSVLTLYMSGCVSLDQPTIDGPSRVFLVVKEVSSRGYHVGLGATQPLEAMGSLSSCVMPRA